MLTKLCCCVRTAAISRKSCRWLHPVHTARMSLCRVLNVRTWLSPYSRLMTYSLQFSSLNQIFIIMRLIVMNGYTPHTNFWMSEPVFMKLGMYEYIIAPEPISTAYFINPSHQSTCLYVYPPSLLGNDSVNTLPLKRIHTAIEELCFVFCAVFVVSKESRR
jgi:hypothetical protein